MQPYPHSYHVTAAGRAEGVVTVSAERLPDLATAPPAEFDGPGDRWSPETLLCAAMADCFILTFRSLARVARLEWVEVRCAVTGILERADGRAKFTRFEVSAQLSVAAGVDVQMARHLVERSEHLCLVSNSMSGVRDLKIEVRVVDGTP